MERGRPDDAVKQAVGAFIAELRHRREVAGRSQKALAKLVGYTPSYVSKVESGHLMPSREFADSADRSLKAGRAIVRRWQELHDVQKAATAPPVPHQVEPPGDPQSAPGTEIVVEHEIVTLTYRDGTFRTDVRRQVRNTGDEPVTRYLVRISVDRFPGDPVRSNEFYREDPLRWEEIELSAHCGDEPMDSRRMHDRDAFKEVWLLFENSDSRFPLYPGESTWIEYRYSVPERKWGPWWQRAIRLPTRRLTLSLDFPSALKPVVWGIRTSMTAEPSPFPTPITREEVGDRTLFTWSTENPQLHTRYRIEWKFKAPPGGERDDMDTLTPSRSMAELGIVQEGDPILAERAVPFDLPAESQDAHRVVTQLAAVMHRVSTVHTFAKGMGLAAPQIGIGRAVAIVRAPDGEEITLLNPRVIGASSDLDDQYEGCLSFFDVRGLVPRPTMIEVAHEDFEGRVQITEFRKGLARLVAHEIDHLEGHLYRTRMRAGVEPIPVSQYTGTGSRWSYQANGAERP